MKNAEGRRAFLCLGSNLGDREAMLKNAVSLLGKQGGIELLRISSVYETEPWGVENQPMYLNCVLELSTSLIPETLLDVVLNVERMLGRERGEQYAPRTIDIDILLVEGEIQNEESLTLPHPLLPKRRFALVPLGELAPDLRHPVLSGTINDLIAVCGDMYRVRKTDFVLTIPTDDQAVHDDSPPAH